MAGDGKTFTMRELADRAWHCRIGRVQLKRGVTMRAPFNCWWG